MVPLAREVVGDFRPALFALLGAAALLLVITCTNVASLLLARATVREREVAVQLHAVGRARDVHARLPRPCARIVAASAAKRPSASQSSRSTVILRRQFG